MLCVGLDEVYEIVDVGVGNVEDIDEGGMMVFFGSDTDKDGGIVICESEAWIKDAGGEAEEHRANIMREVGIVILEKLGASICGQRAGIGIDVDVVAAAAVTTANTAAVAAVTHTAVYIIIIN